jgi:hypothetical protein
MDLFEFNEVNLANALSNQYTPAVVIEQKNHFKYFLSYLGADGLNAKSLLVEHDYINKDFLFDYASYYAFCFQPYPKTCKRVHFWDVKLPDDIIAKVCLGSVEESTLFTQHYLGFIVVKPIPVTVIGYSILKTYTNGTAFGNRHFWGLRNYHIHLLGVVITIESLAFQEQDSVLAACATTAIWSMLNKAALDYHTVLKSPSQITKDAASLANDGSRLFPNKGLDILQICQAIYNSGLVSEVKKADFSELAPDGSLISRVSHSYLKQLLNAYSTIGIPIILVVEVPNNDSYGLHAITVSGFKKEPPVLKAANFLEISWLADNIDKIYAHDDQHGPFVRVDFLAETEINTPWTSTHKDGLPTYVRNLIVPVYPKLRISYEDIKVLVLGLDRILSVFFQNIVVGDLVWDVHVDFSVNYKEQIRESELDPVDKLKFLQKSLPKYIWIASCYIAEYRIVDFTFDATDVINGMIGLDVISYLPTGFKSDLAKFITVNRDPFDILFQHQASCNYYDFLIANLQT